MSEQGYNGWRNYETWVTKLWIDNDQSEQEYWLEQAKELDMVTLAGALEFEHDQRESALQLDNSVFSDLMRHALGCVDWFEIAKSLIEDAKEINE